MNFIQFLSAFGLGAVVTACVQAWLTQCSDIKKRNFQEKKECYIGLLEAYHRAALQPSDQASKNFAYWQMRCELVGPQGVRDAIQKIVDTNENQAARHIAHEHLKSVLRRDLNITV